MATAPHFRPIAIAPANGVFQAHDDEPETGMPYTCVSCTRRKVKCDKTGPPCSTCKRARLECYYEAPQPRKRKRKTIEDVHERLKHYERLLQQHGLLDGVQKPQEATPPPAGKATASTGSTPAADVARGGISKSGRLLSGGGKSRFINSTLWRNLNDEDAVPSSSDEDETDSQSANVGPKNGPMVDPLTASLFAAGQPGQSLLNLHPTYDAAMKMWQIYLSHVDPLTKLLHVPTTTVMIKRAAANPSTASKSTECLLFAVYHFAMVAMSDEECESLLEQDRSKLQSRYYTALIQAFVNASFLRSTEYTVMQAYVLFLLSVRNQYDPHTFWILTGVGTRIAQRLGLHRDPDDLGLKPFEGEMRRRLFWQLLPIDGIASQLSGTGIAFHHLDWDIKQPANLNDEDLYPEMAVLPPPRSGATEMLWCLMRTEMGRFHQKTMPVMGNHANFWQTGELGRINEMEGHIKDLETRLENLYIRFCDPVNPVHLAAMLLGQGAPQNARLRLRLPRAKANNDGDIEEPRKLWQLATKMFDYVISAQSNPELKKYQWHMQAVFQWDGLIWVLNQLRRGSLAIDDPLEAWQKLMKMYECLPNFLTNPSALHVAIRKLTLKAWDGQPARFKNQIGKDLPTIRKMRVLVDRRHSKSSSITTQIQATPESIGLGVKRETTDPQAPTTTNAEMMNEGFLGTLEDYSPDAIDWMFWEQLIQDNAYSANGQ